MDDKDKIIAILLEENRMLKERIAVLERRLGLNSETSSKPPSSDGLKKRPPISSRGSNKAKGGQKGHKGKTLNQVEIPDRITTHTSTHCPDCQRNVASIKCESVIKRQVFDVEINRVITEHQAEIKICSCGKRVVGSFPENVKAPVQIGDTLKGIALYLSEQFIPKDRLSTAMEDLFSISVSDTILLKYETQLAQNLRPFYEDTLEVLKNSSVKQSDETGMRVGGKTHWIHTLCNQSMTYLSYSAQRKCPHQDIFGILVHDHFKSYLQLENVQHAFCNAHHLRELKSLMEYEKEEWASKMHTLLRKMCHLKNEDELTPQKIISLCRVYDKILDEAFYFHEGLLLKNPPKRGRRAKKIGHNLAIRLRDFKEGVLLFLNHPDVPFTNNQAERDLRMVKVKQKVSGCFRTTQGVENFSVIRSFIGTVRKNALNVLDAIKMAITNVVHLNDLIPQYKSGLPAIIYPDHASRW